MTGRHQVIAISGIPGAGKTRAALVLAERMGAAYLPFDDFEALTERDADHTVGWLNRGAPWQEMYDPALDDILMSLAEQGPVVFETPLGRQPPTHSAVITCAIWIDLDRDIALARKLKMALDPRDWSSPDDMSIWLCQFLENYQHLVRPCLELQAARVRLLSDHIIDGTMSCSAVDAAVAQIVGSLHAERHNMNMTSASAALAMER